MQESIGTEEDSRKHWESELAVHVETPGAGPQAREHAPAPGDPDDALIAQIVASRCRDGLRMVSQAHAALWKSRNQHRVVELWTRIRHAKHRVRVTRGEAFRAKAAFLRQVLVSYLAKWLNWPRVKFVAAVIMVLITATASVVGVWKLLQATPTFADSPIASGVLAALVGAVPFGIKVAIYANQSPPWRVHVKQCLGLIVVLLFVAFAVLLAFVSGGLGAPVMDASAFVDGAASSQVATLSIHLQWVQLLLEVSVGLACLCFADDLYEAYGCRWAIPDRIAWLYAERFQRSEAAYQEEFLRLGVLRGEERRLPEERKAFVARAQAAYLQKADQAKRQEDGIRRQKQDSEPLKLTDRIKRFLRLN